MKQKVDSVIRDEEISLPEASFSVESSLDSSVMSEQSIDSLSLEQSSLSPSSMFSRKGGIAAVRNMAALFALFIHSSGCSRVSESSIDSPIGTQSASSPLDNNLDEEDFVGRNIALTSPAYSEHQAPAKMVHPLCAVDDEINSAWNAGDFATPDKPIDIRIVTGPDSIVRSVTCTLAKDNLSRGLYVCKLLNEQGVLIDARHVSRVVTDHDLILFDFDKPIPNVAEVVVSCEISGGSWVSWREININGSKPIISSSMKRFGYYYGIWSGIDHTSKLQSSNVIQIEVGIGNLEATLEKLKANNQTALIYMWHYFKGTPTTDIKWRKAVPHLKKYEDVIEAFVTKDEPYLNGWKERIEGIASIVKKDFPSIPIAVNFAATEVRKNDFRLPQHHDWISFDFYLYQGAASFNDWLSVYQKLQEEMLPHHKFYITADGSIEPGGNLEEKQHEAAVRAREYYNWGIREEKAILLLPFMWPNGDGYIGSKNLPILESHLDMIATEITGR